MHAYAINADSAVITPLIKPSENIANNIIAKTRTIVYPKFFTNVDKIFSSVCIVIPFVMYAGILYHIFNFFGSKKTPVGVFYHFKRKTPGVSPRDVENWRSQPERPIKCPERKLEGNLPVVMR